MSRGVALAAALALALALTGSGANAADPGAPERPKLPLPEMQRLATRYLGIWRYTERYANGVENTGVYTSAPGPGGNSIVNHFHSQGPAGEFEGLLIMTWDAQEKAYKEYVFGENFQGALIETGQWLGDSLTFRASLTFGGGKVALRNTTRFTSDSTITSEQFSSAGGGPEALVVHVEAARKR
jgi:hypothetical protein